MPKPKGMIDSHMIMEKQIPLAVFWFVLISVCVCVCVTDVPGRFCTD